MERSLVGRRRRGSGRGRRRDIRMTVGEGRMGREGGFSAGLPPGELDINSHCQSAFNTQGHLTLRGEAPVGHTGPSASTSGAFDELHAEEGQSNRLSKLKTSVKCIYCCLASDSINFISGYDTRVAA